MKNSIFFKKTAAVLAKNRQINGIPFICCLICIGIFIIGVSCQSKQEASLDQEIFIPVKDNRLYLRLAGNKSGPIVLMLHGGPGGCSGFDRHFYKEPMEGDFLMGYLDQRGCGKSPRESNEDLITMEQFVADLDIVIDTLHQRFPRRPIHLLGGSWGGTLGFLYLLRHQDKVRSFVAVSAKINGPYENKILMDHEKALAGEQLASLSAADSLRADSLRFIIREIHRIEQGTFDQFFEDVTLLKFKFPQIQGFNPYWYDTAAHHRTTILGKDPRFYQEAHYDLSSFDSVGVKGEQINKVFRNTPAYNQIQLDARLADIHIPVAVIGGAEDYVVGPGHARLIYDCLTGLSGDQKELHILPGAAHNVNVEAADLYYPVVKKFLSKRF